MPFSPLKRPTKKQTRYTSGSSSAKTQIDSIFWIAPFASICHMICIPRRIPSEPSGLSKGQKWANLSGKQGIAWQTKKGLPHITQYLLMVKSCTCRDGRYPELCYCFEMFLTLSYLQGGAGPFPSTLCNKYSTIFAVLDLDILTFGQSCREIQGGN